VVHSMIKLNFIIIEGRGHNITYYVTLSVYMLRSFVLLSYEIPIWCIGNMHHYIYYMQKLNRTTRYDSNFNYLLSILINTITILPPIVPNDDDRFTPICPVRFSFFFLLPTKSHRRHIFLMIYLSVLFIFYSKHWLAVAEVFPDDDFCGKTVAVITRIIRLWVSNPIIYSHDLSWNNISFGIYTKIVQSLIRYANTKQHIFYVI